MSGTKTFGLEIERFVKKTRLNADLVVRKLLIEFSTAIVMRSPADTGRFRANWRYSFGPPDKTTTDATDADGKATVEALTAAILAAPSAGEHHLFNNLPYAQVIEFGLYPDPPLRGSYVKGKGWVIKSVGGYSKQAPAGVVRRTILEFQTYLDRAVASLPK